MFNPLSSWDIRWTLSLSLPKEFLDKIIIIEVPLKFKEFLQAIKEEGKLIVPSLKRYFKHLENIKSCTKKCNALAHNEEQVGKWWSLQAFDISPYPEAEEKRWFFPIFDNEDYTDWSIARLYFKDEMTIVLPMMNTLCYLPTSLTGAPLLGTYGLFVYHSYLLFKNPNAAELLLLEKNFPLSKAVSDYYLPKVRNWREKSYINICDQEKELLAEEDKFIYFCRSTISAVADVVYNKSVREFFYNNFEKNETENLLVKQQQNCSNWLKTTIQDVSLNETVAYLQRILNAIKTKLTTGKITMLEARVKTPSLDEVFKWRSPRDIRREILKTIEESIL
ncbi:MAG: hypothetical protein NT055_00205 [Nitrospirae bacterium]|nr:hypothetical protein [Nitrospirota bacterium]